LTLTWERLVAELFPRLSGGIRWGLDRTRRLLATVGDPHLRYPAIHIGGTNGKGSVAAATAAILRADGRRVGLYTSPHLLDFRERFRVDGELLPESAVLAAAERLWPAIETEKPSFFEATTALGFLLLADAAVEVAVVEVGLGGRLDATNVVEPVAVALTNVDYDHMQYLGDTLPAIAGEKAGIIKAGVPVVTAEPAGPALDVFRSRAAEVGAPLFALGANAVRDVEVSPAGTRFTCDAGGYGTLRLATTLAGTHQARNAALAAALCDHLPAGLRPAAAPVERGLRELRWPGRFQVVQGSGCLWVLDVAHNAAGIRALTRTLGEIAPPRPVTAVVGVLGDKEWRGMLLPLSEAADSMILTTPPGAPPDRLWDPETVALELGLRSVRVVPALAAALDAAAAAGGTAVVTGSFHTVGQAMALLGIDGSA
jgi:dihydrofolate synthase / folylpolyglutamate synthase